MGSSFILVENDIMDEEGQNPKYIVWGRNIGNPAVIFCAFAGSCHESF